MPIGVIAAAVVGGAASVIAGSKTAGAAREAGELRAESSALAIEEHRAAREEARTDFAPWRAAGETGLTQLQTELGLTPDETTSPYAGGLEEFYASDVYQFPLQEGLKAITASASGKGLVRSGGALKDITRYAQGVASQGEQTYYDRQQDYLNRLGGLAGLGQTAVAQTAAIGQGAAANIGTLQQNIGKARATGVQQSADAFGTAIGGVGTAVGTILGQI
ncbi:MAG: hypothetical protein V3T23_09315 [Nitrososphaerales archaeon]